MEAVPAPLGSPWTHAENGGVRRYGIACGLLMLTSRYAGRTTLSWPSSLVNPECTREGREAGNCGDTERNTIACKGYTGVPSTIFPVQKTSSTIPITAGTTAAPK